MRPEKIIELTNAIAAVCPVDGISLRANGTVVAQYRSEATEAQQAVAIAIIDAFDADAPVVPQTVTPYQARCALTAAGLREAAEVAIAAADQGVRDAWEYALTIERSSPFIAAIGAALGLSPQQVDGLFISAAAF